MNIKIEDIYRLLPRETIYYSMALSGPVLKILANHRPGRFFIRNFTHGPLGRIIAGFGRVTGLIKGRNIVELTISVMEYYFEPTFEIVKANDDEVVFFLSRCPYGFRTEDDVPLCDSVMQFERELVDGIGGTHIIEETIPTGSPKCRFTVRANYQQ